MTVTRRQAREWAVQMLTAADLNPPEDVGSFIASEWEQLASEDESAGNPGKKMKAFTEERVSGVLLGIAGIDAALGRLLENWDIYRLGTVERAVLRMGIWEMGHTDVPHPVIINEAVDLSNWFSSPSSRSIVNGILDKYSKTLTAGNRS